MEFDLGAVLGIVAFVLIMVAVCLGIWKFWDVAVESRKRAEKAAGVLETVEADIAARHKLIEKTEIGLGK